MTDQATQTEARRIALAYLAALAASPDAELADFLTDEGDAVEQYFEVAFEECMEHQAQLGSPTEADLCAYIAYFRPSSPRG